MTAPDLDRLWRKLSNNQRIYILNESVPPNRKVRQSHFINAGRSLARIGLTQQHQLRMVGQWAQEHGYACQDGPPQRTIWRGEKPVPTWTFHTPEVKPRSRIDPDRLTELAAAGHYAADIAKKLGVSREAVRVAAKRHGLTIQRKPTKPRPPRHPRVLRPERLVFHVSTDELAAIRQAAAQRNLQVSTYLRELCTADTTKPGGTEWPTPKNR